MYNRSLKSKFIRDCLYREYDMELAEKLFDGFSQYEIQWEDDLCAAKYSALQEAIPQVIKKGRVADTASVLTILTEYSKWCVASGIPGSNMAIRYVETEDLAKIRREYFRDPGDLAAYLRGIFDDESICTQDCILHAFMWLLYMGIKEETIFALRNGDFDFDSMIVAADGERYKIYPESLVALFYSARAEQFLYIHSSSRAATYHTMRERIPGDLIMRGVKRNLSPAKPMWLLRHHYREIPKDEMVDIMPSKNSIIQSGLFYKMYCNELAGIPVDFTGVIEEQMANLPDIKEPNSYRRVNEYRYNRRYNLWKIAFQL